MIHFKNFNWLDYKPKTVTSVDKRTKEKIVYCDDILTFDCETTNYYLVKNKPTVFDYKKSPEWYAANAKPQSLMYIWMFSIDKTVVYGRTNADMLEFFKRFSEHLDGAVAIVYVHNLSFDFNFIQNGLGKAWEVFSRKERKLIYGKHSGMKLEFRCSLMLTNKPLAMAGKEVNAPVNKMSGDLDYDVLRTPLTQLTDKELGYCEHDCLVLYYVIAYKVVKYGNVYKVPYTQTGQIRRELKSFLYVHKQHAYKKMVKECWPDADELQLLMDSYYGGYVHANARHSNKILKNVYSYDITSSYPHVLCTQKFPVKSFSESYQKNLDFLDGDDYAYIADITLFDVKAKGDMTFLSVHKGQEFDVNGELLMTEVDLDNGRIVSCNNARYILTDCDLRILNKAYTFKYRINNIWTAAKDYLPKMLIAFILQLFADKTQYKDVAEFESRYKEAKEFINSVYGMFVTKIIADQISFVDGEWITDKMTKAMGEEKLAEMATQEQICSYSTGVWTAAYARKHLWDLIFKVGNDVVYCDTDSVKFIGEHNKKYFEEDNLTVDNQIKMICDARGLLPQFYKCDKPKGGKAELGYFESDGSYAQFKTLGAKKYAYIAEGDPEKLVHITVAGVNKKAGAKYFKNLKMFAPQTLLDYEYAGKKMVKYNDNQVEVKFPDGFIATEKVGCVLTPSQYMLDITKDYNDLIALYEALMVDEGEDYDDENSNATGVGVSWA